jgi:high-affinity nickel-transport protein
MVVLLMAATVAFGAHELQGRFEAFKHVGGVISTCVSAFFLLLVAIMNIFIMMGTWETFHRVKNSGQYEEEDMNIILARGGWLARIFRPVFKLIRRSWHMFPLGFLFGLGFDTATEVALLAIAATEASKGVSVWSVLVFPALFTAGMSLVDSTDGILMLGAYGWAFLNPLRKLFYNLTVTAVSVVVALLIGGIETLGLIGDQYSMAGRFWTYIRALNDNFGTLGYLIIGLFALTWFISMVVYRVKGYDRIIIGTPTAN